jgi:hypothetical protein
LLAITLLNTACATGAATAQGGGRSRTTAPDARGLGIMGAETPPALKIVAARPYHLPPAVNCAALDDEVVALDTLLGPDVDTLADPTVSAGLDVRAGDALGSALRGAIPYRGTLRWLTHASAMDKQLRQAILAGAARRGFLKGIRRAMACPTQASSPLDLSGPAQGRETEPPESASP